MGVLVYILGQSGTGKSYSMHNFGKALAVINIESKILPFRGSGNVMVINSDDPDKIKKSLSLLAEDHNAIAIDDFQYLMANEYMRRSAEKGYDKFTEIGKHAWDIAQAVKDLPAECIVYIMCHTDRDQDGNEKLKTIGKMLDDKIVMEGMATIVLKTNVSDGHYTFLTQNNGKDTTKSPFGMFPSYAIDNDLKYVDDKIRNYYGLSGAKTDAEMAVVDSAKTAPEPETGKRTRKTREIKPTEAVTETTAAEVALESDSVSAMAGSTRRRRRGADAASQPSAE